ncbi:LysR family transcriptional regulator [Jeongeupia naejangsanensis]|uniref:LysR family transcriptional regulator n=1 Tax=Jeongeupia naejangsanensis TaxID=613195 RepID=A0ABS2BQD1_9NEIS|nr:LysR family transcriptional regulator [Jeongeupia naejangsanensis]MBM3116989.1 LysR family transcriptional regulator [Jeongeupia naejangsanensis]
MTLTQLEIFALIADLGSFTAAANRLGISQSAVSHALRAFEQELGIELLQRRHGGITLTEAGQQTLNQARTLLGVAETMRQTAAEARGLQRGTLRIGSFGPTSSVRLLPTILTAFRTTHPGIDVFIDEGPDRQILHWLDERRIDLGFVVLPHERFDTHALAQDQLVALLAPGHPLATQASVTLPDLCNDAFILTEAGSAELVTSLFAQAGCTPRIRYRYTQLLNTLDAVARGDGVTVVAESALPRQTGANWTARPLTPPALRSIGLAMLDESKCSPAARAFVKIALQLERAGALTL